MLYRVDGIGVERSGREQQKRGVLVISEDFSKMSEELILRDG
jgi:hypothetical protein